MAGRRTGRAGAVAALEAESRPASIASSTSANSLSDAASLSTQASSYASYGQVVLPRGAKASQYDMASEEDVEIWAKNKLVILKGRATLAAELAAQAEADQQALTLLLEAKRAKAEGSAASSDLSDLEDSEAESQPRAKRARANAPVTYAVALPAEPKGDPANAINCGLYSTSHRSGQANAKPNPRAAVGPLLPLPVHLGTALIEAEREFELPVPMLQRFVNKGARPSAPSSSLYELLPAGKRPPPFQRIRQNQVRGLRRRNVAMPAAVADSLRWLPEADTRQFVERHKVDTDRIAICMCKRGDPCGPACVNRIMRYFCSSALCPAGDSCTNRPFALRKGAEASLRVCWTEERGFGLTTVDPIRAGSFVMQYVGQIISRDEAYRRSIEDYKGSACWYMLDYDKGEVIDAGTKGNEARFINHSCGPLLEVQRWRLADNEEFEIGLFAINDIPADTELSYDYGFQAFSTLQTPSKKKAKADSDETDHAADQRCHCGAAKCRGWLSGRKHEVEAVKGGGGRGRKR